MHCCPAGCYGQDPSQSGCVKVEQIDDKAEFADLDAAILQCIPEGGAEKKGTLFQIERVMVTMGETIIVQRSASAAKFCRDSVVKEMYSRIFVTSLRGQGVDRDVAERVRPGRRACAGEGPGDILSP